MKKVRVMNHTSDITTIRAFVIHLDPNIEAVFDVIQGNFVQNNHMTEGSRGVVVYDDFGSEAVLVTGSFELDQQNVSVIVTGSSGGYTLAFATFV